MMSTMFRIPEIVCYPINCISGGYIPSPVTGNALPWSLPSSKCIKHNSQVYTQLFKAMHFI